MYNDESEFSKMKLPEGLLTNYKIAWGRFVAIRLDNAPDCDTMSFRILLDMKEREILGKPDEGDNYRRWFDEREVGIYHDFVSLKSYDGVATISGGNDEYAEDWKISCHTGYDELWEGELPNNTSGNDLYEAVGKEKELYQLYRYVLDNAHETGV